MHAFKHVDVVRQPAEVQSEVFLKQKGDLSDNFPTQPFLDFTENGPKMPCWWKSW